VRERERERERERVRDERGAHSTTRARVLKKQAVAAVVGVVGTVHC
jgi:hypothetical protein